MSRANNGLGAWPRRGGAALLAVCGLLLSACSSGGSQPASTSSHTAPAPGTTGGDAATGGSARTALQPLPAAIPAALASYYRQKLDWRACDGSFECATFKVPLDYAHPGHGDLTLAAARKKATGPGPRTGSLVLNPGGPGGSGITYLENVTASYAPPLRATYDLVGFDPRGVGRSDPVQCLSGPRMDAFAAADVTPDDAAEKAALVKEMREFAAGCEQRSRSLLPHVDTIAAARDMDVLRALLGDAKLTYVGKSYGTYLGAAYAGLFPGRVGRMVLDGALDPSLDARQAALGQAAGFEVAWSAFAKDCASRSDCPLGRSPAEVGTRLDALFRSIDRTPLATGSSRRLTEALATTGVIQAMYADFLWPQLRTALKDAQQGKGAGLLALSDSYYDRRSNGSYGNLMFANEAVNCLDSPAPFSSPDQVQAAVAQFVRTSPHFGRAMAWMSLACAYWPVRPTGGPHTIAAAGAPPIVVVGTTRDPATPYVWARALAAQLSSGRLLTFEGDGHTAYGGRSDCIDTAVNTYLLEGQAPGNGKVCSS
ncbi:alpha/beta hydrolase [Streptacidiphilus griseoplanus]|uniref:alpha/beta hydrolase n=1 Tax=Peterkaempfera griseoplana TaxID=66896 RepID=UPI0006E317C9|nr:alpha/beta hydrolase [Peterkaempfera griseoplana]